MAARRLDALCINLDRSPDRWDRMQGDVAREFGPSLRLTRQRAVDGERDLPPERLRGLVTTHTLFDLANRLQVCDALRLNSLAAVGCFLSHRACWEWLVARPEVPWVLILEDDVCVDGLRDVLTVQLDFLWGPDPPDLDFLVLGYLEWFLHRYQMRSPEPPPPMSDRLRRMTAFWGAHCYLVTQHGARRLLALSATVDIHLDFFLGVVCHTDGVRGFLLRRSACQQCRMFWQPTIPHWKWSEVNVKMSFPDVAVRTVLWFVLALVLLAYLWRRYRRRK